MFDEKVQIVIITISCFGRPTVTTFCSYVTKSLKMKLVLFITIMLFWHKSYQLLHFCFERYIYTAKNKRENENSTRESFCNKKASILTRDIRLDLAFNKRIENEILLLVIDLQR